MRHWKKYGKIVRDKNNLKKYGGKNVKKYGENNNLKKCGKKIEEKKLREKKLREKYGKKCTRKEIEGGKK